MISKRRVGIREQAQMVGIKQSSTPQPIFGRRLEAMVEIGVELFDLHPQHLNVVLALPSHATAFEAFGRSKMNPANDFLPVSHSVRFQKICDPEACPAAEL
jgi:hypothetical protein